MVRYSSAWCVQLADVPGSVVCLKGTILTQLIVSPLLLLSMTCHWDLSPDSIPFVQTKRKSVFYSHKYKAYAEHKVGCFCLCLMTDYPSSCCQSLVTV